MFCAPTKTFDPLQAGITVGRSTGEGNSAISSRVCPATSGKKASTNAWASAGVLYIFQLAAISALRDMFWVPQFNFRGCVWAFRVTPGTLPDEETPLGRVGRSGPTRLIRSL